MAVILEDVIFFFLEQFVSVPESENRLSMSGYALYAKTNNASQVSTYKHTPPHLLIPQAV